MMMNKNDLENRSKKTGAVLLKGNHWYSAPVAWLGFAWIVSTSSWHCQGDSFTFSTQQKKFCYQSDGRANNNLCHACVGSRSRGWKSEPSTWLFSSSWMLLPPLVLYKVCWLWRPGPLICFCARRQQISPKKRINWTKPNLVVCPPSWRPWR